MLLARVASARVMFSMFLDNHPVRRTCPPLQELCAIQTVSDEGQMCSSDE